MAIVLKDIDDAAGVVTETREILPSHYLFKIESFSLFSKIGIDKYESSEFETGGCKWRLVIYPDGKKGGTGGSYISVYLSMADSICQDMSLGVNAVFGIFLRNQISDKFFCKRVPMSVEQARRFDTLTPAWGFSKFISKEMFEDPSSGFLLEDSCIFGAEVFAFKKPAIERLSLSDVAEPYTHSWNISKFSKLDDKWYSEDFSVGGCNWYLSMDWDNNKDYDDCNIRIYLVFAKDNLPYKKGKVRYTLRIKDQINGDHYERMYEDQWFEGPDGGWGSDFMTIAEMNSGGFLVNDCCIVEVEMSVVAVAQRSP